MDVVKLWSTLLASSVCSIPTAYFVQGTANVHVLTYGNEFGALSSPSPASDVSESCQSVPAEEEDDDEERTEDDDENCDADDETRDEADDKPCDEQKRKKIHRNRYSREEYRCTTCPYTCTTEKAFLHHLRNCCARERESEPKNNEQLQLSCPICGKDRKGDQSMSIHMKKHKDNKHFCCDICKFKTLQLKKLIQHRRMHTGEKPHLCPFCSYRSARRDNLRSHARRVHKEDSLPCDTFRPRNMVLEPSK